MPSSYRHICDYEREIIEEFNNRKSLKRIAEAYGFSYKQVRNFKYRYNCNQRKTNAGQAIQGKADRVKIKTEVYHHQYSINAMCKCFG